MQAKRHTGRLRELSACERCGAVFFAAPVAAGPPRHARHARPRRLDHVSGLQADQRSEEYGDAFFVRGRFVVANEKRSVNASGTLRSAPSSRSPQRRVVSIERRGDVLEVLTTSQKLAHRIVHELKKVFRGRAIYNWSDDGTLLATWRRER